MVGVPLIMAGTAFAVMTAGPAADAGGYPWATASCQGPTATGTLSNGQQGTVCANDNWLVQGHIHNSTTGYDYRNCTDFVAWKLKQAEGITIPADMGNASNWGPYFRAHGNAPSDAPSVGAIAWRQGGDHVAYVDSVSADKRSVTILEYNEQFLHGNPNWGTGTYDSRTVASGTFQYISLGGSGAAHQPTPTPGSSLPSGTSTVTSPATLPLPNKMTMNLSATGGYTARVELDRGALMHAGHLKIGTATLGAGCAVDPQADAVVPFHFTITNTTGFSSSPTIGIRVFDGGNIENNRVRISADVSIDGATQCLGLGSGLTDIPNDGASPLPGNGTLVMDGFFIASNYYTPDMPNGSPALYAPELLRFQPDIAFGTSTPQAFGVDSVSGALDFHADGMTYLAFDPAGDGGCTVRGNCPPLLNMSG